MTESSRFILALCELEEDCCCIQGGMKRHAMVRLFWSVVVPDGSRVESSSAISAASACLKRKTRMTVTSWLGLSSVAMTLLIMRM